MIRDIKITTETGSIYKIDELGICKKFNKSGDWIDSFKVFIIKAIPDD